MILNFSFVTKNYISFFLRIHSDNNIDNSIEILSTWLVNKGNEYHGIEINFDKESNGFEDENGIADWSTQRFLHVINLREKSLIAGSNMWADFLWVCVRLLITFILKN